MKTLYYDSINPATGTPFTWDDPNLIWSDPSYYLEPGDQGYVPYGPQPVPPVKPKKKPFHRARKPLSPTPVPPQPNNTTMATFKYNVAPLAAGGFTTRAVLGPQADSATLAATIAAATGVTAAQVELVAKAIVGQMLDCSQGSNWSGNLFGCLTFRPTSGGSQPMPGDFHNPVDINADITLRILPELMEPWRAGLSIESMGEVGKLTPVIDTVINLQTNVVNTYIPGDLIQVRGDYLKFDKADLTQGIFFKAGAAAEVRATIYGTLEPRAVSVMVPASLTGPLTVRVATFINGSVRNYTYSEPITL